MNSINPVPGSSAPPASRSQPGLQQVFSAQERERAAKLAKSLDSGDIAMNMSGFVEDSLQHDQRMSAGIIASIKKIKEVPRLQRLAAQTQKISTKEYKDKTLTAIHQAIAKATAKAAKAADKATYQKLKTNLKDISKTPPADVAHRLTEIEREIRTMSNSKHQEKLMKAFEEIKKQRPVYPILDAPNPLVNELRSRLHARGGKVE